MVQRPFTPGATTVVLLAVLLVGCAPVGQPSIPNDTIARQVHLTLEEGVQSLAVSPNGKLLATGTPLWRGPSKVQVWELHTGRKLTEVIADDGASRFVTFSPDGKRLAVVCDPHRFDDQPSFRVNLWDVNADEALANPRTFEPDTGYSTRTIFRVAFSPDGGTLAAGTGKEVIYLWDAVTGQLKRRFQGGVAVAFAADGRTLIAVTHDGLVRRFDTSSWLPLGASEPVKRNEFLFVTRTAFSADGRLVALSDELATWIKDAETNRVLCRLYSPTWVSSLSFSVDGNTLAVASENGTHFFDSTTGMERAWLKPANGLGEFLDDGKLLACFVGTSFTLRETAAVLACSEKAPQLAWADPPNVPLEAELIARQGTYTLDLEGDSPEDFSARLQFGEGYPETPDVDLLLKLRNTGKEAIRIREPIMQPLLHLVGPGALSRLDDRRQTGPSPREGPGPRTLAPGESFTSAVSELSWYGFAFWILPGEYSIAGWCSVAVAPPPNGSDLSSDGFGNVRLRLAPIQVKVQAGKKVISHLPPAAPHEIHRPPPPGTVIVPQPDDGSAKVRDMLVKPGKFRGVDPGTPLKDALSYIGDRYELDIRMDEPAFEKGGAHQIGEKKVGLPPLTSCSLETAVQALLDQVDAGMEIRGHTIWIVPTSKPQTLAERLPSVRKQFLALLSRSTARTPEIPADTPLADAVRILNDQYELNILLDARSFERNGIKDIARRPVRLAPQSKVRLGAALGKLLKQVGATFVPRDRVIVVIPEPGG
jgi:WD40 repeat protein